MDLAGLPKLFANTDWAVVLATIVGPVAAVVISIWLDRRARERERRLAVINMLIHGRTLSFLAWNQAMIQLPLEFKHDDKVMECWEDCNKAAREQRLSDDLSDALIKAALKSLGFPDARAGQAVRGLYRNKGVETYDQMHMNALTAMPALAEAAGRSAVAAEQMLAMISAAQGPGPSAIAAE
jgi:hypothetical protein